jgi:hypothetical protein
VVDNIDVIVIVIVVVVVVVVIVVVVVVVEVVVVIVVVVNVVSDIDVADVEVGVGSVIMRMRSCEPLCKTTAAAEAASHFTRAITQIKYVVIVVVISSISIVAGAVFAAAPITDS